MVKGSSSDYGRLCDCRSDSGDYAMVEVKNNLIIIIISYFHKLLEHYDKNLTINNYCINKVQCKKNLLSSNHSYKTF